MRVATCAACSVVAVTWGNPPICTAEACREWGNYYEEHLAGTGAGERYLLRARDERDAREAA